MGPRDIRPPLTYKLRTLNLFLFMKQLTLFLIISLLVTGCSSLQPKVDGPESMTVSPAAEALYSRLQSQNSQLQSFKGTGRMRIEDANGTQRARIMWAGYGREKLRLEIMGATGQSLLSFAYDGERIYLISHAENRFYSKRSSNASLEKLISLPISVSESLDLLAGRIPMEKQLLPIGVQVKENGEHFLVLKSLERNTRQKNIIIDTASGAVRRIEVLGKDERLEYQAEFTQMQNVSGFEVPRELRISKPPQAKLQLVVEQFWPNAAIPESLFVLDRPD